MNSCLDPNCTIIDASYCRFGAEALAKLFSTIESQSEGVQKNEDIEYVHKMRVSSRRIRAAMPLFKECFPKKSYKKWLKQIKKVTQFLGAARDLDVQVLFIKDYISKLQPIEPKKGVEALLEQHINQRSALQSGIIDGLQELETSKIMQQAAGQCDQIIKEVNSPFNLFAVREKAFWQISSKIDEFLAMEDYVHKEDEILKHHQMRIRAKWLRYTLEVFAPLYQGEFAEEIKMMKNFQDTLGEMHDCDVWIDSIPKFIDEMKSEMPIVSGNKQAVAENDQSLLKFLGFIKEKRRSFYQEFVSFWDENKSKNRFEELRKNASAGFTAAASTTKAELTNPYVKIGVISDVHANLHALEAVFEDAKGRGITVFLNAGDIIGFGAFPNEVIEALYSKNTLSVIGNLDLEILDKSKKVKGPKKFSMEYARRVLKKSHETYLSALPLKLELEIAQKKLLMVHGSPVSIEEHLRQDTQEERFQELAKNTGVDLIIFGHSHEQFTKKADGALFINPGSVGRPGDGNPQAAYAAVSVSPFSVELIRVNYDVAAAADALRRAGAPESYAQMLLQGLSLDNIIAEDQTKEKDMEEKCAEISKRSQIISQTYWPDLGHEEQVRKLSLELFDSMQDLHKLGKRERCWLECAAILHDIGLAQGPKGHHKNTLKIILNETKFPFSSCERQVIGNIARYHRKGCPKSNDYSFISLNGELRRKVKSLAGILRLADGLDFSHQSIVQNVEAHVAFEYVTIEGFARLNPVLEEYAVNKKKDMFEQFFKKKLVVAWKQVQSQQQTNEKPEPTSPEKNPENRGDGTGVKEQKEKSQQTSQP